MATLLSDDFNRANDITNVGSPAVGGPYTERVGTTWGINGNALYTSTALSESVLTFPGAINVDFSSSFPVTTGDKGMIVRWVDANNYWYLSANSGNFQLHHRMSGTFYQRSAAYAYVAGASARIVTRGPLITVYLSGLERFELEDESYAAATATCGWRIHNNNTARIDDALAIDSTALSSPAGGLAPIPDAGYASNPVDHPAWVFKGRDRKTLDTTIAA